MLIAPTVTNESTRGYKEWIDTGKQPNFGYGHCVEFWWRQKLVTV